MVSQLDWWCALALMAVVTVSTTANVALRHFSRAHLAERLEAAERDRLLNRLVDWRDDLIFCSSVVRVCAMLALVLLITHVLETGPIAEPVRQYAVIFATALLTLLIVGVAIPNAWARYAGHGFLVHTLPALIVLRHALWPLLVIEHLADGLVRRLAGVPRDNDGQDAAGHIEREILVAVSEGEAAGAVHEEDADMIASVMEFRDKDVAEIMTPRTEIIALPTTATLFEAKEMIVREGHSRIPVYGMNIDDIQGVLYAKDLLSCDERDPFDPTEIMRKVPFVPETKRIPDLLTEMRKNKVHLAIVVDEYGGTAGLVTIEDIIEEIVGEIGDEYEPVEPALIR
ncbi:MAG TPA: hemolysin family protein, partial [Phycisphaerae bacterium]|nr:hemolysin family protein [Phycisphaerae bacterium]